MSSFSSFAPFECDLICFQGVLKTNARSDLAAIYLAGSTLTFSDRMKLISIRLTSSSCSRQGSWYIYYLSHLLLIPT